MEKILFQKKATLIEIRESDQAQKYQCSDNSIIWLHGRSRPTDINIGATGTMKFKSYKYLSGWIGSEWIFIKEDENNEMPGT